MSGNDTIRAATRFESPVDGVLAIFRRRWPVILACLIVFPAVALLLSSRQEELYQAQSTVLVNQQNLANGLTDTPDPALRVDRDRLVQTQIAIAQVPEIARRTLRALKIDNLTASQLEKNVTVSSQGKTDLIAIAVTDPDPQRARRLATMYAAQYAAYRAELDTAAINRTLREVNSRLGESGLSKTLRDDLKDKQAQLRTLQTLQTKNSVIVRRGDSAVQVQPAAGRNVALSLLLGFIVGCALAMLIDSRDRRIRDGADIASLWGGALLGRIPAPGRRGELSRVAMIDDPNGAEADAYRRVLAKLEYAEDRQPIGTLLTVSATDAERRTEIVANLAVGFARAGRKVIAIDFDFLSPRLSELFGLIGRAGVSDVAVGRTAFEESAARILLPVAHQGGDASSANGNGAPSWDAALGVGTLDVLGGGSVPSNPSDFIGSPDLRALIERLQSSYDIVLMDAPGLLHASDASRLCRFADATLAASSMSGTNRADIEECARMLEQTPAPLVGVVSTNDEEAAVFVPRSDSGGRASGRGAKQPQPAGV